MDSIQQPKSISSLIKFPSSVIPEKKRKEQERDAPFNELYSLYCSQTQRFLRKKENWKRYRLWLMSNRTPHNPENVQKFKRVKSGINHFIEEWGRTTFAIKISHIKTPDLYYCLSIARDKENRKEPIGAWLFQKPKLSTQNT